MPLGRLLHHTVQSSQGYRNDVHQAVSAARSRRLSEVDMAGLSDPKSRGALAGVV
jgi:hypothetical protein